MRSEELQVSIVVTPVKEWDVANAASFLLSRDQEDSIRLYIRGLKKDLEDWSFEHNMWSKYHNDFWFKRAFNLTTEAILEKFYRLADLITFFEPELKAYETILANHMMAVEVLNDDMTALRKVNLKTTELIQKPLFQ